MRCVDLVVNTDRYVEWVTGPQELVHPVPSDYSDRDERCDT